MQREKLYNLHKINYFTVTFFALKIDKIPNGHISMLQKSEVFRHATSAFLAYCLLICFILKKYTTRCNMKNSTICKDQFILYM